MIPGCGGREGSSVCQIQVDAHSDPSLNPVQGMFIWYRNRYCYKKVNDKSSSDEVSPRRTVEPPDKTKPHWNAEGQDILSTVQSATKSTESCNIHLKARSKPTPISSWYLSSLSTPLQPNSKKYITFQQLDVIYCWYSLVRCSDLLLPFGSDCAIVDIVKAVNNLMI